MQSQPPTDSLTDCFSMPLFLAQILEIVDDIAAAAGHPTSERDKGETATSEATEAYSQGTRG